MPKGLFSLKVVVWSFWSFAKNCRATWDRCRMSLNAHGLHKKGYPNRIVSFVVWIQMMIYTSRIDLPNGEVTYAYNHLFEQGIFLLWFTKFYNLRFVWYHFQFSLIWKYKQIKGIVCFDVFFFIKKTKKKTHHLKNTLFGLKIFWQIIIVFFVFYDYLFLFSLLVFFFEKNTKQPINFWIIKFVIN
jgi:hypothetical protein